MVGSSRRAVSDKAPEFSQELAGPPEIGRGNCGCRIDTSIRYDDSKLVGRGNCVPNGGPLQSIDETFSRYCDPEGTEPVDNLSLGALGHFLKCARGSATRSLAKSKHGGGRSCHVRLRIDYRKKDDLKTKNSILKEERRERRECSGGVDLACVDNILYNDEPRCRGRRHAKDRQDPLLSSGLDMHRAKHPGDLPGRWGRNRQLGRMLAPTTTVGLLFPLRTHRLFKAERNGTLSV